MANEVVQAEHSARIRAWLMYMMAIVLIIGAAMNYGMPHSGGRLAIWLLMAGVMAANLLPGLPLRKSSAVLRLMNDETTRDHRRSCFTAGFWAAIAAALAMTIVADHSTVAPFDVSLITVTASLTAALICFATLELRAAGD